MAKENDSFRSVINSLKGFTAKNLVHFFERLYAGFVDFLSHSRHTFYRLVIMNNDTFEEVGSYKLSMMNFYVFVSSALVALTLLVTSIIVFTPIKKYIPGYGGVGSDRQVYELADQVDVLEKKLQAQQTYTDHFKKLLIGDVQTQEQVPVETVKISDSLLNVHPSQEDAELRAAVANGSVVAKETAAEGVKPISVGSKDEKLEQMFLLAPLKGQVALAFSPAKKHFGVDVVAPKNTVVMAVSDGFVVSSDWTLETGNTIGIQHANNLVSFYKHNASLLKKEGDKVKAGEAIAIIGNTGEQSSGPHLHFELWKNGLAVNPLEYINF